jgi:L-asparaginase
MNSNLPRIAVVGCGGTISSIAASSLDVLDYFEFGKKISVETLLEHFPETRVVAETLPVSFGSVSSFAIGPREWLELRTLLHRLAAEDPKIDGFVIPHGTASLEETAYFLNLTLNIRQPVVLVGAQRPVSALSSDAGMNLVASLRVAGTLDARAKGVLIVLNDEIHAARDAMKTSTYRVQTFRSLDFGALGHVDGDGVYFYRAPLRRYAPDTEFASIHDFQFPRVDIVYSYAGADGVLIDAAVAAGASGIVLASFAPGVSTPLERAAIERGIANGVAVVQCSRAPTGRIAPRRRLRESSIIAGDNLSPQKARILLGLMLCRTNDPDKIGQAFQTY